MTNKQISISPARIYRIKAQGYCNYSDTSLSELAFGNRFAYIMCSNSQYSNSSYNDDDFRTWYNPSQSSFE